MAESQTKNRKEETGSQSHSLERRPLGGGMLRRDPFWSPSEFSASPFGLMRRFAEQMEHAFPEYGSETGRWAPAIDVTERDGKLQVRADLPGLSKNDVKIETIDNQLVIQGERRQEQEQHDGGSWRSERRYGSFYRSIPLPEGAQTEQARAEFKDGVLEITVPVPASANRARQIPIEGGTTAERKEAGSDNPRESRVFKAG